MSNQTTEHKEQSELSKVEAVQQESEVIGRFLDWALEQGVILCKRIDPSYENDFQYRVPIGMSIKQLLGQYFQIDLEKVDQEQKVLLEAWNKQQHTRARLEE